MLLMNAWLLKLQSRPRIRRLKLSGTVQGLVQESAAFDGRTMRARSALGAPRWRELRRFGGGGLQLRAADNKSDATRSESRLASNNH